MQIYGIGYRLTVSGRFYLWDMKINCDTCIMKNLACGECVISVLLEITSEEPRVQEISENQVHAISVLAENGLVPPLRFAQ